jgi:hypothetical protein
MKRIILFSYFLFISFFCFAQQNLPAKIIGGIPPANSGRIYQIQVGAYRLDKNAQDAILRLKSVDLEPATEKFRGLTRVLVKEIPASQIRSILSTIAKAGFREVIVRIDTPSKTDAPPVSRENSYSPPKQENTYDPPVEENTYTPPKQENKPKPVDILCKTWKIENCPNPELIGSKFYIMDDGTYYVTNPKGESSSFSEWRRRGGTDFEYSHNNWEYYGRAEIINLTDNALELIDSGYSYDTPGNSSAGYNNRWVFSKVIEQPSEDK